MRIARRALAFVSLLFLAGCIEVSQEIWINADGSGRLKMDIGFSEALLSFAQQAEKNPLNEFRTQAAQKQEELKKDPNVKNVTFSERKESGTQFFTYDVEVRDVTKIAAVQKAVAPGDMPGAAAGEGAPGAPKAEDFHIEKLPSGNVSFRLKMESPGGMGGEEGASPEQDQMAKAMMASMFGDKAITVKVHGPRIVTTNGKLDAAKTTAEWRIPLVELASAKKGTVTEMTAEVELAGGGGLQALLAKVTPLHLAIGAGVLVLLIGVIVLAKRR